MSVRFEVVHIIVRNTSYITVKLQIAEFKLFFRYYSVQLVSFVKNQGCSRVEGVEY